MSFVRVQKESEENEEIWVNLDRVEKVAVNSEEWTVEVTFNDGEEDFDMSDNLEDFTALKSVLMGHTVSYAPMRQSILEVDDADV